MATCSGGRIIDIRGTGSRRTAEKTSSTPSIHLLPCKIQCTCDKEENKLCRHPAKVDTFFDPVVRKTPTKENGVGCLGDGYSATFRGRPLRGVLVNIAEGYAGQVLRKSDGELGSGLEQVCAVSMGCHHRASSDISDWRF